MATSKRPTKASVIAEYLDRFPDAATKTIARKAYKENPALWPSLDACYTATRRARGNQGAENREKVTDKTHYRPNQSPGDPFVKLPKGMVEMEDWGPVAIETPGRYLIVGDLHCPYHDDATLRLILEAHANIDALILLGDVMDCFALSRWEPDPRERDFAREIARGRELMAFFRDYYPQQRIIYKLGNHDERLEKYLACKAPELLDVADFEMRALLRCESLNIEVVSVFLSVHHNPNMFVEVYIYYI